MLNVVELDHKRNDNLIDELQRMLAQAEAGEIIGTVAVKLRPDHTFAVLRSGDCSDLELCGALCFAIFDVISNNKSEPDPGA